MSTSRSIVLTLLMVLIPSAGIVQAQTSCAQLESRWGWGLVRTVAEAAGTVYYGTGSNLVAIDSATDAELGRVDVGGVIHDIVVVGHHAYLAGAKKGLVVVDVSSPAQMRVLAHTDEPEAASAVAAGGDTVVVTDVWRDVWIFDIADPTAPQHLATFDATSYPVDVTLAGDYAVIAEQTEGARVIDLSDRSNPQQVALLDTPGDVTGVTVVGSTLFVADGGEGLKIVDFAVPSNPVILGALPLAGHASAIAVEGTTAWVAADYGGYDAVDISDLANPTLLSSKNPSAGTAVEVAAAGSRLWLATWAAGVVAIDGADPSSPQETVWYQGAGETRSVAALGEYAVVADWSGVTLRVLDLSPAGGPEQIGALELPGYVRQMEVASNKAYVALEWGDFVVVDLSDPTNPSLLGSVNVEGSPQYVALMGNYALVATEYDGLHVVDITHPEAPSVVGSVEIPERAMGVSVSGATAYIAAGSAGLVVVDVASPSSPVVVASLDLSAVALHTAVDGNLVYVSGYSSGFFAIDVTDRANPRQIGWVDASGYTRSSVISGDLAFIGNSYLGLVVVDISDPTNLAVLGSTGTPGSGWYGAFVGGRFLLADDDAGVAVFDVAACGQGPMPPHADYGFAPAEPRVGDTVTFTDLSTGDPTNWRWWFSDDNSTSSQQHPNHVFASAGGHEVRLEVSNQNGSANISRNVIVRPAAGELPPVSYPFAATMVIPAAAHVGGAHGTAWVTDVVLHNPGGDDATAYAFFLETEVDSSASRAVELVVPSNESVLLADAVLTVFGMNSDTGAILIGADRPLTVSSRTYNTAPDGTYGQYIAAVDLRDALAPGESATIIQLAAGIFRSNLGVANPSPVTINLSAEIYSKTGQRLERRSLRVPPWSHLQVNGVFSSAGHPNISDGYAVLTCGTLDARWFAYASVVDNRSGDPVYAAPVVETSGPLWIAAAARAQGANDTNWRTDLELFADSSAPSELSVKWHGPDGGAPRGATLSVTAAPCQRVDDVLEELYSDDGSGALRIEADHGMLAVTSRTFNDSGNATYGQFIPAMAESDALHWGETARLVQLAHSPDSDSGFRTNLGFVNTTARPTTLFVELRDGDGSVLDVLTIDLGRRQYLQINNVFNSVTDRALDNAYALVATSTGEAAYLAYASVVDNRSGDPVFIPAVREP